MKIFKYSVNYDSKGDITGTIEHIDDLEVMSKRNLVKQIVANKHGLDISKMSSNFYVTRDYNAEKEVKNQQSNNRSNNTSTPTREISQEERDLNRTASIEADRERRADRAEERERKAIIDERQRLIDIEEVKVRAEQEARERAERKQRANELRSQGKNFQAFLVEFQNGVIGVSVVLGLALFFFFFTQNQKSNMADAMKINSELEQIEDSVKIYINNKKFDKALVLANKLVHNSHEDMEQMEFDTWSGYPKFDEYWTKKREEYKKIIFNKGSLNTEQPNVDNKKVEETKSEEVEQTPTEEDKFIYSESDTLNNQEGLDDEYKN
jgi:hypothetical protein